MDKLDSAYKTIGEVAKILNLKSNDKGALPTHVIRFWETQFKQIKPKILNSNRRYYDEKTINLLKKVKFLLKDQGMTINGVKKILNNENVHSGSVCKPHFSRVFFGFGFFLGFLGLGELITN